MPRPTPLIIVRIPTGEAGVVSVGHAVGTVTELFAVVVFVVVFDVAMVVGTVVSSVTELVKEL